MDKKKVLSKFSNQELLRELTRRMAVGGGSCWSCHSEKPTYQCMNQDHQNVVLSEQPGDLGDQVVW